MYTIDPYERSILTVMLKINRPLTAGSIARRTKLSWNTVEKNLKRMYGKGWLSKKKVGRRVYWEAIVK